MGIWKTLSQSAFIGGIVALSMIATAQTPLPKAQPILGPNGELPNRSWNEVNMSRDGRYIVAPVAYGSTYGLFVRDIKTQNTKLIQEGNFLWHSHSISANGRYVAYKMNGWKVYDQQDEQLHTLPHNPSAGYNLGLSDRGDVVYVADAPQSGCEGCTRPTLISYNLDSQVSDYLYISWDQSSLSLGDFSQRFPTSADGTTTLFYAGGLGDCLVATDESLIDSQGENTDLLCGVDISTLSSSGRFGAGAIASADLLVVKSLKDDSVNQVFDMSNHDVDLTTNDGFSISDNGRFISFLGYLKEGHPEYADGAAIPNSFSRIFRFDTQENQIQTVTLGYDGGAIYQMPYSDDTKVAPLVNNPTVISADGSMVTFATNAYNITTTPPYPGGEENYHSFVDTGVERNYLFMNMPNAVASWNSEIAPALTLIDDHLWEGVLHLEAGEYQFVIEAGGNWVGDNYIAAPDFTHTYGPSSTPGIAQKNAATDFTVQAEAASYRVRFNDETLEYSITPVEQGDWQRTVIFMLGETQPSQDMFIRGGIDHGYAQQALGINCTVENKLCAIPIRHLNLLNTTTAQWKANDEYLDWYGAEPLQSSAAQGSPLDWTTDVWPSSWGTLRIVAVDGYGETPLNLWGQHYWMLDIEMDCSKTIDGWFELKSFISNGPGWEADVNQADTPYKSGNHFARCGEINRFQRGNSSALFMPL